jgi:hypothetical protein
MEGRARSGRAAYGKEDPHQPLCDRPYGQTRVPSVRQLPTDHDYAARPANIRLINRRKSTSIATRSTFKIEQPTTSNINIKPG